jgi:hypothetical protein
VQRPRWFTVVDPDAELTARAHAFAAALASVPRVRARVDVSDTGTPPPLRRRGIWRGRRPIRKR